MNFSFSSDQDPQIGQTRNFTKASEFSNIQLKEENIILKEENQSLKSQLSRVKSELFPELENAHMKIRELTTQLQESNKNCDNLQNRLKLSQMKCQEIENKRQGNEAKYEQLQNEKNLMSKKCQENQEIIDSLNIEISNLKDENNQAKSDEQQFFSRLISLSGKQISSYSDVLNAFIKLKDERPVEFREINVSQELPPQNEVISSEAIEKIKSKFHKYKEIIRQLQTENQTLTNQLSQKDASLQKFKENEEFTNNRLQDTLSQLQDSKKFNNEKEYLYDQLNQVKEQLEIDNSKKDGQIHDLTFQIQNIQTKLSHKNEEHERLVSQLSQKTLSEQELTHQIQQYKKLTNELQEKCSKSAIKIASINKTKKHIKARLAEAEAENKSKIAENSKKITSLELENQRLEEDNKTLLSQLQAARASHAEANSAYNSVKKDSQQMERALSLIKSVVEKQKDDFQIFAKEKEDLICLIRKQSQLLTEFEQLYSNEQANSKVLTQQVKKLEKENAKEKQKAIDCVNSIDNKCLEIINNSFTKKLENEDEIRNKLVPILVSQTSTPVEKIETIFQIIFEKLKENKKILNQLNEKKQKEELVDKEIHKYQNHNDNAQSILKATISGFYKFLNNQEISPIQNQNLINFISNETDKLESFMKENKLIDPQFISVDLLFNGSLDDRKRAIQAISNEGWNSDDTFSLFSIASLINICQEKELIKLRKISEELSQVQRSLGCTNASEVLSMVTSLSKKLKKAKTQNQSLLDEIQNSSVVIPQNEELQQVVQSKEAIISNLNQEIEKIQKEKEMIQQQNISLEKSKNEIKIEMHQKNEDYQKHVFQLEKTISDKINEIEELKMKASESMATIDSIKQCDLKKDEQIKELQNEIESLTKRIKLKEKQHKQKVKQIIHKYEDLTSQLEKNKNDIENKLNESLKNYKSQNDEKDELVKRMADSLENSEKRNKKMLNDLYHLNIIKKSNEMKIQSLIDQMKREEQMLTAKFEFKLMALETKHQEDIAKTRVRYLTERDHVIIHVLHCFDELDQFDDKDISVPEFEASVSQVGKNYLALKKQQ